MAAALLDDLHRPPHQSRGNALSPQSVVDVGMIDDIDACCPLGERHFAHLLAILHSDNPVPKGDVIQC